MEESFEKVVSKFAGNFVNLWLQLHNLVRGSHLLQSTLSSSSSKKSSGFPYFNFLGGYQWVVFSLLLKDLYHYIKVFHHLSDYYSVSMSSKISQSLSYFPVCNEFQIWRQADLGNLASFSAPGSSPHKY